MELTKETTYEEKGHVPVYTTVKLAGLSLRASAVVIAKAEEHFDDWHPDSGRPKSLPLTSALNLSLKRLRRNPTYAELAEDYEIAPSTAWEYHQTMVQFLVTTFGVEEDELPRLVAHKVCLIDGSLIPTFDWRSATDMFSGKHKLAGMNVLLISDLHGRLIGASKAYPGGWHDKHCLDETGWETSLAGTLNWIGDVGFAGTTGIHRTKKRPGQTKLTQSQYKFNKTICRLRAPNEWGVGHIKNWRILTTRYRSQLRRIDTDIQAAVGLQKLNEQFSEVPRTWERVTKAVSE